MNISVNSYAGWLAFTMYVAAANYDATPEQREELRFRIRPLLFQLKEESWVAEIIMRQLHEVMGLDWRPTGAWAQYIEEFLKSSKE